jgi:tetratricopeptide (TPR) repeat protein
MALWMLLALQEGTVDEIMIGFSQRMELARTPAEEQSAVARALEALRRVPADHPDAPRAAFHAAEMLLYGGKTREAAEAFRAFPTSYPREPNRSMALFSAAGLYEELEEFGTARDLYRQFARDFPDDAQVETAALQASMDLLYAGKADEALAELRTIQSWPGRMRLALAAHLMGRREECEQTLGKVRRECPDRGMVDAAGGLLEDFRRVGKPIPDVGQDARGVRVVYLFSALSEGAAVEAALFKKLHARHKGLSITGICVDAVPEAMARYQEEFEPGWTIVHDPFGKKCAAALGTGSPPFVMVADREGTLRFLHLGGRDLEFAVRGLLK